MKNIVTHVMAFIAGVLAITAAGLVVCEIVENVGSESESADFAD